jgi:hypothetical protein
MTAIDEVITNACKKLEIQKFGCFFEQDGKISASELKKPFGCIVYEMQDDINDSTGTIQKKIGFYMFAALSGDKDVNDTDKSNPLQEKVLYKSMDFVNELKSCPYLAKRITPYTQKSLLTNVVEVGREFIMTFDYYRPCLT